MENNNSIINNYNITININLGSNSSDNETIKIKSKDYNTDKGISLSDLAAKPEKLRKKLKNSMDSSYKNKK